MSPFKFAIPVLGALVLMSAMPGRAEARGRTSFDVSVGFGYSNYNGYGYGNYNNASFRYYNGPRYYSPAPVYYAPAPVYYAPAPAYCAPPVRYCAPPPVVYYRPAPSYNYYNNCGYSYPTYRPAYGGGGYYRNYYCD